MRKFHQQKKAQGLSGTFPDTFVIFLPWSFKLLRSQSLEMIDGRQITHLICVHLKHLLYDFWGGGVLGLLPVVFLKYKSQNTP